MTDTTAPEPAPVPRARRPRRTEPPAGRPVSADRTETGEATLADDVVAVKDPVIDEPAPADVTPADVTPADVTPADVTLTAAPGVDAAPRASAGSVSTVAVEALDFERGAIGGVRATDVAARLAVVGGIAANDASVEMGVVSGILAREVTVQRGLVRGVVAQDVHVEQAIVRSVVANRVETGPTTAIFVALARSIDGEAKVLLDWRGALAFGAALGGDAALIRVTRR